jgi:hypothetical protein
MSGELHAPSTLPLGTNWTGVEKADIYTTYAVQHTGSVLGLRAINIVVIRPFVLKATAIEAWCV